MKSFAEKYRARSFEEIIGQSQAIDEINSFLEGWPKGKKALVLHGPPGTGKTTLALIAASSNNFEIFELNASDLRNKQKLEDVLKPATEQTSLFRRGKIILMDEVDGVTGTDRGGIPELVKIIGTSSYPIIMTCNDVWQSKLSPIRSKSKLVEMRTLSTDAITSFLNKIAEKENLRKDLHFLRQIAIKSQGDIRAALNDLQSHISGESIFVDISEKRNVQDTIFNILRRLFKEREPFLDLFDSTKMSLDEIFLWIEENIPKEYSEEALVKAYNALGQADVFRGRIYRQQHWRFLVYQNAFQSAGISFAKLREIQGFTKYEPPKRILKIWLNNQKIAKKKTIARKYAGFVHCSTKRIMRDFELLRPILKQKSVQEKLRMSEEEIDYLQKD